MQTMTIKFIRKICYLKAFQFSLLLIFHAKDNMTSLLTKIEKLYKPNISQSKILVSFGIEGYTEPFQNGKRKENTDFEWLLNNQQYGYA